MNFDIGENCPNFVQIEENVHPKMAIITADMSKKNAHFRIFFYPKKRTVNKFIVHVVLGLRWGPKSGKFDPILTILFR